MRGKSSSLALPFVRCSLVLHVPLIEKFKWRITNHVTLHTPAFGPDHLVTALRDSELSLPSSLSRRALLSTEQYRVQRREGLKSPAAQINGAIWDKNGG